MTRVFLVIVLTSAIQKSAVGATVPADWKSRLDPKVLKKSLEKPGISADISGEIARTLFHGDISVEEGEMRADDSGEKPPFMQGQLQPQHFWPKRDSIPYVISPIFRKKEVRIIKIALDGIKNRTFGCIAFKKRSEEDDYLFFQRSTNGRSCRSFVGRRGGQQFVHLTPSCTKSLGNIQHEVMHALGIFHEQSRPDRDVFVELYAENIVSIFRDNFEKLPLMDTYNLGYDLDSVMHYGMNEFAVNKSAPNLLPRAKVRAKMGQRNGISILDAAKLQTAYNCPFDNEETTTAIPSLLCPTTADWKEYKSKCYFFSFLSKLEKLRTFKQAEGRCKTFTAKIANPAADPGTMSFIAGVLENYPGKSFKGKAWIAGCCTLAARSTEPYDEERCDVALPFVCEMQQKKTSGGAAS